MNKDKNFNPYYSGAAPQYQNNNMGYPRQPSQFNYIDLPPYLRNHPEMAGDFMGNQQAFYPDDYNAYPDDNYYNQGYYNQDYQGYYNQGYYDDPYQAIVNQPTVDLPAARGINSVPDLAPKTVGSTYKSSIAPNGSIVCISGMYRGADFPIKHQEAIVFGTNSAMANIVLSENAEYVSKKHCTVIYDAANANYIVIDHSSNGTYLQNGLRLTQGVPKRLEKGSIIYLANSANSFKLS